MDRQIAAPPTAALGSTLTHFRLQNVAAKAAGESLPDNLIHSGRTPENGSRRSRTRQICGHFAYGESPSRISGVMPHETCTKARFLPPLLSLSLSPSQFSST